MNILDIFRLETTIIDLVMVFFVYSQLLSMKAFSIPRNSETKYFGYWMMRMFHSSWWEIKLIWQTYEKFQLKKQELGQRNGDVNMWKHLQRLDRMLKRFMRGISKCQTSDLVICRIMRLVRNRKQTGDGGKKKGKKGGCLIL